MSILSSPHSLGACRFSFVFPRLLDHMRKRRSVALLLETSNAYSRGLLDGIIAYQREHELWSIYIGEQQRGAKPPLWFINWQGDGIIARIET